MGEPPSPDGRGAVFLDRDGTIVHDDGFLHEPDQVRLLPGAGAAIRRLNEAGWPVVTVTNQSGIARGRYSAGDYFAVQRRLSDLLGREGARIDAAYFCPHHPLFTGPCDCRKPGTLLFEQAGAALGLDLAASWYVGDRPSDVAPALTLGGQGLLVLTGLGSGHRDAVRALEVPAVADLAAAVEAVLAEGSQPRKP